MCLEGSVTHPVLCRCHFFNSFFYAKLVGDHQDKYDYQGVRRWTTRASVDIFAMDKVRDRCV